MVRPLSAERHYKARTHFSPLEPATIDATRKTWYRWIGLAKTAALVARLSAADRRIDRENPRVAWAEHQTTSDPKRDISCFFSSCFIYWNRVMPACVYDSLIPPVGPNRTEWTWTSDSVSIFFIFWYLNGSAATSTSKVTKHKYHSCSDAIVQRDTAVLKNTDQIEAKKQPNFFKKQFLILPKLNTKSVIWVYFLKCTHVTSHNKKVYSWACVYYDN